MGAVRDPLPVAVPAFHGNRMDVPRRLRPGRLLGLAQGQGESSFRDAGNPVAAACCCRHQHRAISGAARCHFLLRQRTVGSRVFVLWIGIRASAVADGRTPIARGVDSLPSIVFRTKRDAVQSEQKLIRFRLPTRIASATIHFTGQGQLLWVRVSLRDTFGWRFSLVSINLGIWFCEVETGDTDESMNPEESTKHAGFRQSKKTKWGRSSVG